MAPSEAGGSESVNERLISEIQRHPWLYNSDRKDYHDKLKKENSWRTLSTVVGVPYADLMTRWRGIRDRYGRELKMEKIKFGKFGGKRKTWYLYPMLHFLRDFMKPRRYANMISSIQTSMGADDGQEESATSANATTVNEATNEEVSDNTESHFFESPGPDIQHLDETQYITNLSTEDSEAVDSPLSLCDRPSINNDNEYRAPSRSDIAAVKRKRTRDKVEDDMAGLIKLSRNVISAQIGQSNVAALALAETLATNNDDVGPFLVSLAPRMRMLSPRKKTKLQIDILNALLDIENS